MAISPGPTPTPEPAIVRVKPTRPRIVKVAGPAPCNPRISLEQVAKIGDMLAEGKSRRDIAESLRLSKSGLAGRIAKLNLPKRQPRVVIPSEVVEYTAKLRLSGMSLGMVAAALGISKNKVTHRLVKAERLKTGAPKSEVSIRIQSIPRGVSTLPPLPSLTFLD